MAEDKESNKFERKENINYLLCEHLENNSQDFESNNIWLGDNTRLIICPVCTRVHIGSMILLLNKYPSDYISKFIHPEDADYVLASLFWERG
jgi:hypothetical protein